MRHINENSTQEGWDDWKGEITKWDDPKYADNEKWGSDGAQTIDSSKTSHNFLPKSVLRMRDHNDWVKGSTNFNMGGGVTDNMQTWLSGKAVNVSPFRDNQQNDVDYGITDLVFDPFSRDNDFNEETLRKVEELGGAETVTCNNVLNVIDSKQEICNVIQRCAEVLKPNGVAYFLIYVNGGSGIGVKTSHGYQQRKKAIKYVPLVHKYFEGVKLVDDMIIAKDPIPQESTADWFTNADDSLNGTNPRKLNLKRESKMNKKLYKLTESDLHTLIRNSVEAYLKEGVFNYTEEGLEEEEDFQEEV